MRRIRNLSGGTRVATWPPRPSRSPFPITPGTLLLTLSLCACGGGSGGNFAAIGDNVANSDGDNSNGDNIVDGTSGNDTEGSPTPPDVGGRANAPLVGSLVVSRNREHDMIGLDLLTGRIGTLPGTASTIEAAGLDRSGVTIKLEPDHSRFNGMIATVRRCRSASYRSVCVLMMDGRGNVDFGFEFTSVSDTGLVSGAKRSRDGRYIALRDRGENADNEIDLYTIGGRYLSSFPVGGANASARPFDWLPGGELLIARTWDTSPVKLIRTEPYTTTPARTITLPASISGKVVEIVTSPAGDKALVSLEEGSPHERQVVVIDFDTLVVTSPFSTKANEPRGLFGSFTWSPDGRWLYMNRSFNTGGQPSGGALRTRTQYAVRIDGSTHVLSTRLEDMRGDGAVILLSEDEDDRDGRLWPGEVPSDVAVWLQ